LIIVLWSFVFNYQSFVINVTSSKYITTILRCIMCQGDLTFCKIGYLAKRKIVKYYIKEN